MGSGRRHSAAWRGGRAYRPMHTPPILPAAYANTAWAFRAILARCARYRPHLWRPLGGLYLHRRRLARQCFDLAFRVRTLILRLPRCSSGETPAWNISRLYLLLVVTLMPPLLYIPTALLCVL